MKTWVVNLSIVLLAGIGFCAEKPYVVVGTGQTKCYGDRGEIAAPQAGQPFYGQDAQYPEPMPNYKDNGYGTVSDLNTGLTWVKARGEKFHGTPPFRARRPAVLAAMTTGGCRRLRNSIR